MATRPEPLPSPFDSRVQVMLDEPLAPDVVLAVAQIAVTAEPVGNLRWQLHEDGRLFFVARSTIEGDWKVPFDRPLPDQATRALPERDVKALFAALDAAKFWSHAGYENDEQIGGGTYILVRARRGGTLHNVVYQNVKSKLITRLAQISDAQ